MRPDEPMIRSAMPQALLRATEDLSTPERQGIRARLGEERIDEIQQNLPLSWTHMDMHMALSDAVRDVVGPERNVALWRATMTAMWSRPLLKGFVDGVSKVFGLDPPALFKQVPRLYGHLTRELGSCTYAADPAGDAGSVTLRGFPEKRYRFICFIEGLQGCAESALVLTRFTGTVTVAARDDALGLARYDVRWGARA